MGKIEGVIIKEVNDYVDWFSFLKDAYRVLYISYQSLIKEKQKNPYCKPTNTKHWYLEDLITDDLTRNEENFPKLLEYRIVNQQKDADKKTRIDIAIQYSLKFGHSYDIKIECKRLDNLDYLINDGIKGYKTNKYAEKMSIAGFLAYNISNTLTENIELLNSKIKKKISDKEVLKDYTIFEDYTHTYKSNHKRASNSNIDVYTMALNFKDVISN